MREEALGDFALMQEFSLFVIQCKADMHLRG